MIPWDIRYITYDIKFLALSKFQDWGLFLKAISKNENFFKLDYFVMLSSFARPSKDPYFAQYISNRWFLSRNWQNCWCFIMSPSGPSKCNSKCLALLASKKNFWDFALLCSTVFNIALYVFESCALKSHVSKPCLHVFKSCLYVSKLYVPKLCSHIYKPHPPSSTILSLILLALYTFLTLSSLYQILVSKTLVLSQLCQCNAF